MGDGFRPISLRPEDPTVVGMRGISVSVPDGWEARIRLAAADGDQTVWPVLHAATVPLIVERGDYGAGVVETLQSSDVFIAMLEFGPEAIGSALFPHVVSPPRQVDATDFHPKQLQRVIEGQAGVQKFFTYRDRAFCLYVVVGSFALVRSLADTASALLQSIDIDDFTS